LGEGLISGLGVEKVEEGFVLEKDKARRVFAVGGFEEFESFFFAAGAGALKRHPPGRGVAVARGFLDILPAPLCNGPAASALKGMGDCVGRGSVAIVEKSLLYFLDGFFEHGF
jgi:hypothetical protein